MSLAAVKDYFEQEGLLERIVERDQIGATVEQAALAIGCEPKRIAKTMSFLVDDKPVLVVTAGDAKVDNTKFKASFHQKAKMIPGELVETLIGHEPGAVCPFAVNEDVKIFLDVSLKRFDLIYTAGGSLNSTIELAIPELEKHSCSCGWLDVCKGWFVNG